MNPDRFIRHETEGYVLDGPPRTKGGEKYLSDPTFRAMVNEALAELERRVAAGTPCEGTMTAEEFRRRYLPTEADENGEGGAALRRLLSPHHYRADGKVKVAYATQQEAEEALKRCRGQNAYQCRSCRYWHLGHRP